FVHVLTVRAFKLTLFFYFKMERRGSRGVTNRRAATKSPTRNKSPGRKSPGRKSPGRKVEPIKEEPTSKTRQRGRATRTTPAEPKSVSPKAELRKVSLSPIKHESGRSTIKTKTTTTTKTSSVKVGNISNESDEEIKRFVSNRVNEANARLTSRYTPSEQSR